MGNRADYARDVMNGAVELEGDVQVENNREGEEDYMSGYITEEEVRKAIEGLKNGKAPGMDGLMGEIYKGLVQNREFLEIITLLLRNVWELERVPRTWGVGLITTIFKGKGELGDPNNYRGITLLNVIQKILCGIMAERLKIWVEERKILASEQAGFRPNFSTMDNIAVLNHLIKKKRSKKGGKLFACFIDFEKAFDSIDRNILWGKLEKMGLDGKFVRMLKCMYECVEMRVKVGMNGVSESFFADRGVRQGCKLSPLLFALFINDLPSFFEDVAMHSPFVQGVDIRVLLFADDVVLIGESSVGLQRGLDKLGEYCERNNLKVNANKSKVIVFRKGGMKGKLGSWWFEGKRLELVREFRYLGVLFQDSGKWKKHKEQAVKKAEVAMGVIRRVLYKFKTFPVSLLCRLFDTMVTPVALYGAEIWGGDGEMEGINRVGTKFCKEVLGVSRSVSNSAVLNELGRVNVSVDAERRWLSYSWKLKWKTGDRILQKKCLDDSVNVKGGWNECVRVRLSELGIDRIWEERVSEKEAMNLLREKMNEEDKTEIERDVESKKSLRFYRQTKEHGQAFYVSNMGRNCRSAIAWARLGGWVWQGRKGVNGGRLCPLCGMEDGVVHVMAECPMLGKEREVFSRGGAWVEAWNVAHWFKTRDVRVLRGLALFWKEVRKKRGVMSGDK